MATAFSNVGADNLAEKFLSLGLKVVRVGKPSGVSESLWAYTLDAAIQKDPYAQKALEEAVRISAKVRKSGEESKRQNRGSILAERAKKDEVTAAVKASIQVSYVSNLVQIIECILTKTTLKACNIAATKALREADVIVSTSIGAADPQLLAACGIYAEEEDDKVTAEQFTSQFGIVREWAPDNLPPLSLPFVIIDEACQSVEPASLIPIVSTNSCRSLVMLGDPCQVNFWIVIESSTSIERYITPSWRTSPFFFRKQLPPTVRSDASAKGTSPLSISLMARLSSISELHPVTVTAQKDKTAIETKFLQCKPTRQAVSTVVGRGNNPISYRKQFSGSVLLSMQFRMHPSIAAFSSAIFYDGLLGSPLTLSNQRQFPLRLHSYYPVSNKGSSVRFVNVGGRTNEQRGELDDTGELVSAGATSDPSNSSYRNEEEAGEVLELLKTLLNRDEKEAFQGSIGIVTPYSSQVALIKSMIAQDEEIREMAQTFPHEIEVKSVE